ncbi:Hypothetical predicted protein [Marmota monax]|uniref:Uncharacterized protein n=1 Tax=Marmota monax TaxID=9995 RepID=A0A5E4AE54_MARMO|nr:hypothetical protein GHT09_020150 [Marmota monax]VTJ55405.1 Hypothetical predicted protein [Marmota monax]
MAEIVGLGSYSTDRPGLVQTQAGSPEARQVSEAAGAWGGARPGPGSSCAPRLFPGSWKHLCACLDWFCWTSRCKEPSLAHARQNSIRRLPQASGASRTQRLTPAPMQLPHFSGDYSA